MPFNLDFTLTLIGRLLKAMQADGRSFVTLKDYFNGRQDSKVCILRHDVDKRPMHSLKMAQLETELGIAGTYYFRIKPCSIDENVIKKITAMGHEIGYHYENLTDTAGDYESAIKDFESGLERLRKLYPIKTICMHGSPLSKYDNKKIWEKYDYRDYGIIADPSFDIDYDEVFYITDTGRSWNNSNVSIRDKVIKTEVGDRRSEIGGQRSEVRGRRAEVGGRRSEVEGQRSEIRRLEGGGRGAEVGDRSSEVRGQGSEVKGTAKTNFDIKIKNTYDLIRKIQNNELPDKIMINVHPQRWSDEFVPWVRELVWQNVKNAVKKWINTRAKTQRR